VHQVRFSLNVYQILFLAFIYFSYLPIIHSIYRGADKSLARPGRKEATATKLLLLQATQKKNSEVCPSNQVSAAAMTSASDEKWRLFNCFFQSGRAKDLSSPLYLLFVIFIRLSVLLARTTDSHLKCTNSKYQLLYPYGVPPDDGL
jgi:hypothetical protein